MIAVSSFCTTPTSAWPGDRLPTTSAPSARSFTRAMNSRTTGKRDVGFEQRDAHLAQHLLGVGFGQARFAAHRLDDAGEPLGQVFEHGRTRGQTGTVAPGERSAADGAATDPKLRSRTGVRLNSIDADFTPRPRRRRLCRARGDDLARRPASRGTAVAALPTSGSSPVSARRIDPRRHRRRLAVPRLVCCAMRRWSTTRGGSASRWRCRRRCGSRSRCSGSRASWCRSSACGW